MVTAEQQAKADQWVLNWIKDQIQIERTEKKAVIIITYDPRSNHIVTQRVPITKE